MKNVPAVPELNTKNATENKPEMMSYEDAIKKLLRSYFWLKYKNTISGATIGTLIPLAIVVHISDINIYQIIFQFCATLALVNIIILIASLVNKKNAIKYITKALNVVIENHKVDETPIES